MSFKYTLVCDTLGHLGYDFLEQPEEILKAIKDAGYDGADLPSNPKRMDTKVLRPIVDSVGLDVPELLGAWAYFHGKENRDLAGAGEEARRRGIEYAKQSIDLCMEMGAQFFEVCAAQPPIPEVPFPKLPIQTLRKNFLDSLREIFAYAGDRGITILLEPLNCYEAYPGVLTSVYEAMAIIKDSGFDNIGIQPDIFHMNIEEASIPDALRATGKYVKHVHMNETNRYSFGSGHADYKAIMKTLKEINFSGYLAIYMPLTTQEMFNRVSRHELKPYLQLPLRYLKEIENTIDSSTITYEMDAYLEVQ